MFDLPHIRLIRLLFSAGTVFFSHNNSAGIVFFSHNNSAGTVFFSQFQPKFRPANGAYIIFLFIFCLILLLSLRKLLCGGLLLCIGAAPVRGLAFSASRQRRPSLDDRAQVASCPNGRAPSFAWGKSGVLARWDPRA